MSLRSTVREMGGRGKDGGSDRRGRLARSLPTLVTPCRTSLTTFRDARESRAKDAENEQLGNGASWTGRKPSRSEQRGREVPASAQGKEDLRRRCGNLVSGPAQWRRVKKRRDPTDRRKVSTDAWGVVRGLESQGTTGKLANRSQRANKGSPTSRRTRPGRSLRRREWLESPRHRTPSAPRWDPRLPRPSRIEAGAALDFPPSRATRACRRRPSTFCPLSQPSTGRPFPEADLAEDFSAIVLFGRGSELLEPEDVEVAGKFPDGEVTSDEFGRDVEEGGEAARLG